MLPAAFVVVLHTSPRGTSALPDILSRAGAMPARHAVDDGAVEERVVLVAPPGLHVELDGDVTRVRAGPRINGHRPSIDVLFRSAARTYGPRVIGVILSGAQSDGAAGLDAIKSAGGYAITQADPLFPGMASSAARSCGTSPPWRSISSRQVSMTFFALALHRPMWRMYGVRPSTPRRSMAWGVFAFG